MNCEQIADKLYKKLKSLEQSGYNFIYQPNVWGTTKINIRYMDFWDYDVLTKQQGINYLNWLNKGNRGRHTEMEK